MKAKTERGSFSSESYGFYVPPQRLVVSVCVCVCVYGKESKEKTAVRQWKGDLTKLSCFL